MTPIPQTPRLVQPPFVEPGSPGALSTRRGARGLPGPGGAGGAPPREIPAWETLQSDSHDPSPANAPAHQTLASRRERSERSVSRRARAEHRSRSDENGGEY